MQATWSLELGLLLQRGSYSWYTNQMHSFTSICQLIFKLFTRSPLKDLLWLVPELGDSLQLEDQKKGGRLQLTSMEESLQRQRRKNKKNPWQLCSIPLLYGYSPFSNFIWKVWISNAGDEEEHKSQLHSRHLSVLKEMDAKLQEQENKSLNYALASEKKVLLYTWDCIATVV